MGYSRWTLSITGNSDDYDNEDSEESEERSEGG